MPEKNLLFLMIALFAVVFAYDSYAADEKPFEHRRRPQLIMPDNETGFFNAKEREHIQQRLMHSPAPERQEELERLRRDHDERLNTMRTLRRERFMDRWNETSEEERTSICKNVHERCAEFPQSHVCEVAENACREY